MPSIDLKVTPRDANGAPVSGLGSAVAFIAGSFMTSDGTTKTAPTFTERGTTGQYVATLTIPDGENRMGEIDCGATVAGERYFSLPIVTAAAIEASPTVTEIDAQLSSTHGAGSWQAGGNGSESVTLAAQNGGSPVQGVTVEVWQGATFVTSAKTNGSGQVTFSLDVGSYQIRPRLTGWRFDPFTAVVTNPDTVTPTTFTGAPASGTATPPAGISRGLDYDNPTNGVEIGPLFAGDDHRLDRSVTNIPTGCIKAWLTVRCEGKLGSSDDTDAELQLVITSTSTAAGQITNDGSGDGTAQLFFLLTREQTRAILAVGASYDVQVQEDAGENRKIRTVERGTLVVVDDVTKADGS